MPKRRQRGFKAFDPFCRDKVRVALYNRPNGPHQGKLVLGKTYLSGLDGKCFSRTGRIKKGYRNVPVDLEREFEIEKRQIARVHNMLNASSIEEAKKKRAESKKQRSNKHREQQRAAQQLEQRQNRKEEQEKQAESEQQRAWKQEQRRKEKLSKKFPKYEKWKRFKNLGDSPRDLAALNKKKNTDRQQMETINRELQELEREEEQMNANKPVQAMNELSRLPNESFGAFMGRVKRTANYHLHAERQSENRETLKEKESALRKKLRKQQEEIQQKRLRKMEAVQRMKEDREFEQEMKGRKEEIAFGETNNAPPMDLHKLGHELFGKRVNNKSARNENNLNVSGLSFAKTIEHRAHQMKKTEVLNNYAKMKQKQLLQRKRDAVRKRNAKRKVWRTK